MGAARPGAELHCNLELDPRLSLVRRRQHSGNFGATGGSRTGGKRYPLCSQRSPGGPQVVAGASGVGADSRVRKASTTPRPPFPPPAPPDTSCSAIAFDHSHGPACVVRRAAEVRWPRVPTLLRPLAPATLRVSCRFMVRHTQLLPRVGATARIRAADVQVEQYRPHIPEMSRGRPSTSRRRRPRRAHS